MWVYLISVKLLTKNNQLSIIDYNIRSLNKKLDAFIGGFSPDSLPSVFNVTETRFSPDRVEQIPGYELYHTTRDGDTPSGGISIFFSKGIKSRILISLAYSNQTIKVCTVELSYAEINVTLIGIYGSSKKMVGKLNRYNFCSMPDRKFYPSSFWRGDLYVLLNK